MTIIRGSTPTIVMKLPFSAVNIDSCKTYLTQKESLYCDVVCHTCCKEGSDCKLKGNVLSVCMTSEETAALDPKHPLHVQVECVIGGNQLVSKGFDIPVDNFEVLNTVNKTVDRSVRIMNPYELDFGVLYGVGDGESTKGHHENLDGRDKPDQHRIASITGLSDILDKLVDHAPEAFTESQRLQAHIDINEGDITEEEIEDAVENADLEEDPNAGSNDEAWNKVVDDDVDVIPDPEESSIDDLWTKIMGGGT